MEIGLCSKGFFEVYLLLEDIENLGRWSGISLWSVLSIRFPSLKRFANLNYEPYFKLPTISVKQLEIDQTVASAGLLFQMWANYASSLTQSTPYCDAAHSLLCSFKAMALQGSVAIPISDISPLSHLDTKLSLCFGIVNYGIPLANRNMKISSLPPLEAVLDPSASLDSSCCTLPLLSVYLHNNLPRY